MLDHLATDETLLLAFAAHAGHDPADIVKARDMLSPPRQAVVINGRVKGLERLPPVARNSTVNRSLPWFGLCLNAQTRT